MPIADSDFFAIHDESPQGLEHGEKDSQRPSEVGGFYLGFGDEEGFSEAGSGSGLNQEDEPNSDDDSSPEACKEARVSESDVQVWLLEKFNKGEFSDTDCLQVLRKCVGDFPTARRSLYDNKAGRF